jgi:hypothetical protein
MDGRWLDISTGFILERKPAEGVPNNRARATASCRLGVNVGGAGGEAPGRSLGGNTFL